MSFAFCDAGMLNAPLVIMESNSAAESVIGLKLFGGTQQ